MAGDNKGIFYKITNIPLLVYEKQECKIVNHRYLHDLCGDSQYFLYMRLPCFVYYFTDGVCLFFNEYLGVISHRKLVCNGTGLEFFYHINMHHTVSVLFLH